ncbi:hypothetical protein ABT154_00950 [Streptomyces sp. NPDC001728]|uniref:hypothetical protein n=1 Tax=Streptomyces sp. NPDC001728 TaxID=3154396 RepID=UPI00333341A4
MGGRVHDDPVQQAARQDLLGFGQVAEQFALRRAHRRVDPLQGGRARVRDLHDVTAPVVVLTPLPMAALFLRVASA